MLPAFPGKAPTSFPTWKVAQTDVLRPPSLAVVAARGVHPLPGPEFPEALSQVLLVDSTLALRAHARRIVNPEEYDGYLFLDEPGGPVMLDATGLEEAVSAWPADASWSRTHGYLTATSRPAQRGSVRALRGLGGRKVLRSWRKVRRRYQCLPAPQITQSWFRLMSSLQKQTAETMGAHSLEVPQQRMPSLFGAPPSRPLVQRHSVVGHVSSSSSRPFVRASFGAAAASTFCGEAQLRPPEIRPPQVPEDTTTTSNPQALLMQALVTQTQALSRLLARGPGADGDPMASLGADPAQLSSFTGVRGAAARDRLRHLLSSSPGYFHSRVRARMQTEVGTPALAGWLGGYFVRYAAFAGRPELGHLRWAMMSALQDGWYGRMDQVMDTLASWHLLSSRPASTGGRWDLA